MPGTDDELPLTAGDLAQWTAGLDELGAAVAVLRAGLDDDSLQAWRQQPAPVFLTWDAGRIALGSPAGAVLQRLGTSQLTLPSYGDRTFPGPMRLRVEGNVVPVDVVSWLLRAPRVASAVLPAVRPPASLRRRRWSWPVRIAVHREARDDLSAAVLDADLPWPSGGGTHRLPEPLVAVDDLDAAPGAVDVVVLDLPLDRALSLAAERSVLANAVIVLDRPSGPWPVIDAQLAALRATTGAVATVLSPRSGASTEELAPALGRLVTELSHARAFDVAVTEAFQRDVVVVGETDALLRSDLASVTGDFARAVRYATQEGDSSDGLPAAAPPAPAFPSAPPAFPSAPPPAAPPPAAPPPVAPPPVVPPPVLPPPRVPPSAVPRLRPRRYATAPDALGAAPPPPGPPDLPRPIQPPRDRSVDAAAFELEVMAEGAFHGESHEASAIPGTMARLDEELRHDEDPRHLNVRVGDERSRNVIGLGPNRISVFLGAPESGALHGPALANSVLGFTPDLTTVRLTVVLVPLTPRGEPTRTELDVPRVGRSDEARLILHVPAGTTGTVEARIVLLHWNRVVQTAVLRGAVGEPARLEDVVVVTPGLDDLESRMRFDAAFVLNHGRDDLPALIRHSSGSTWVHALTEVEAITNRIRRILLGAVSVKRTTSGFHESLRKLLIDLALEGNGLLSELQDHVGQLSDGHDPKRIQIVTARSGRFLPLEFIYPRVAPAEDAELCQHFKDGDDCGADCFASDTDDSVVCPGAFWGMSKIIERQYVDGTLLDARMLVLADPTGRRRRRLTVESALVGASSKVSRADLTSTLGALGEGARQAAGWEEWKESLAAQKADLLVLMPHTTPDPRTMELAGDVLRLERIEAPYVTGPATDVHPIVLLMGCDTSGSEDDPAGFCTRFLQKQAGVVFSSLTLLHSTQAPALTQQLVTLLRDPARERMPMGDLVARFRRRALRDGLVAALAITAYGEADKLV